MTLPLGLLADGAVVCEADGSPIDLGDDMTSAVNAVRTAKEAVIDLRDLGEARPWYDATFRLLAQRLGVDADRQTVAIEPGRTPASAAFRLTKKAGCHRIMVPLVHRPLCRGWNSVHRPSRRRPPARQPCPRRADVRPSGRGLGCSVAG